MEKATIHFGRKSKNSDLAVSISSNFSKADAQDLIASVRYNVPTADTCNQRVSASARQLYTIVPE